MGGLVMNGVEVIDMGDEQDMNGDITEDMNESTESEEEERVIYGSRYCDCGRCLYCYGMSPRDFM